MDKAHRIARAALRTNRVLLRVADNAEDRSLRWSYCVAGMAMVMAFVQPVIGFIYLAIYIVLLVTSVRANRREFMEVEQAMRMGHDHD